MISGLSYNPDSITTNMAQNLLRHIDGEAWRTDLKRRVQHHGYIYDYKRRTVTTDMALGDLPIWSQSLIDLLADHSEFGIRADQMIINEYLPGQGITSHVDCEPCFGDVIASLSLNSPCVMDFTHTVTSKKQSLLLEPNSLLIMRGEARYDWKHGIPARQKDKYEDQTYQRERRVSVTFRKVILAD